MRQENFRVGAAKRRRDELFWVTGAAFVCRTTLVVLLLSVQDAALEVNNVTLLIVRTKHMHSTTFNINILSKLECVKRYRIKKHDIERVRDAVSWGPG